MDRQFCRENLDQKEYFEFRSVRGSVLATAALTFGITFGNLHFGTKVSDLLRMRYTIHTVHAYGTIQPLPYTTPQNVHP